ncbi:MAG: hypothetical protein GY951_00735 [Psychromonas sp.]|nr:hypothetical protein [Alteromonadales bacterium]MCP5076574.1 hypothetical protein [Psychromonas sp.]
MVVFGLLGGAIYYYEQIGRVKAIAYLLVIDGLLIGDPMAIRMLFFLNH